MSKLPKNIYQQLNGISVEKIKKALIKDGCIENKLTYHNPEKDYTFTLHFHPQKTFSGEFVRDYILPITKWTIEDMKELKLIK
jgi:hypothetical protein